MLVVCTCVLVLEGFCCGGRVNAFPPSGSATLPSFASGGLLAALTVQTLTMTAVALALRFRWPHWLCASPSLCAAGVAVTFLLLHFMCSAETAACWLLALLCVVGSTSRHTLEASSWFLSPMTTWVTFV